MPNDTDLTMRQRVEMNADTRDVYRVRVRKADGGFTETCALAFSSWDAVARANASFAASGWDDLTATEAIPYTL